MKVVIDRITYEMMEWFDENSDAIAVQQNWKTKTYYSGTSTPMIRLADGWEIIFENEHDKFQFELIWGERIKT